MHLVSVPQWVITDSAFSLLKLHSQPLELRRRSEGLRHVFHAAHRDIDSETGDTTVTPESKGLEEVFENGRVIPVKVGLGRVEQVEVELARGSIGVGGELGPSSTAKKALPVVGRFGLVRTEA